MPDALGGPLSWDQLSRPDTEQCQRFLAESLSLLLGDVLRSILADASPTLAADESAVERYRNLADSLADGRVTAPHRHRHHARGPREALRHLAEVIADTGAELHRARAAMREFVDALGLFPPYSTATPQPVHAAPGSPGYLTHDRRLDASTREAATALIEACEHLGVLLWPDAETPDAIPRLTPVKEYNCDLTVPYGVLSAKTCGF